MKYDRKSIETEYSGYRFRSRLEAKYAVFFDFCGWPWSYEPTDFNGWIPDFAIGDHGVMVEVKPFFDRDEWDETIQKIEASGYNGRVLLCGVDPVMINKILNPKPELVEGPFFCWETWGKSYPGMWDVNFGFTEGNGFLGLCSMIGAWDNAIWTPPANYHHPNKWSRVELSPGRYDELTDRWAESCNASRWIPKVEA